MLDDKSLEKELNAILSDFTTKNRRNTINFKPLIPQESLDRLMSVQDISPVNQGIIKVADDWVILTQKDNGRLPNDNEWNRFLKSPLDGKISLSFALQWRYNFRLLFE